MGLSRGMERDGRQGEADDSDAAAGARFLALREATVSAPEPVPGDGADFLIGTSGADTLSGAGGGDVLSGGAGADTLYGFGPADASANSGVIVAERIASGLSSPIFGGSPPGQPDLMFVAEQHSGRIMILDLTSGQVSATPFLDLPDSQLAGANEQGLLGMTFHPDYASNGKVYVHLTNASGDIEIREYTRSASNPNVADPAYELIIRIDHPPATNHNGGWIDFGPDGYLYVTTGDGGGGGDTANNAQNLNSLLGKILRLDVDGDDFPGDPDRNYAIPEDNPFVGQAGADEIWAYGLRNPWRCSFDPVTADLWIADVGQAQREEVNFVPFGTPGGINFGWHVREGDLPFDTDTPGNPGPNDPSLWAPTVVLPHDSSGGFAVTGGYVYYGPGGAQGQYIFADYVTDNIWTVALDDAGEVVDFARRNPQILTTTGGTLDNIASFATDGSGRFYAIGLDGEVWRLTPSTAAADGADELNGGDGNDSLYGGSGDDDLNGQEGNDRLVGGLGDDALNGGAGVDQADYRTAAGAVTVNLATGTATGGDGTDTLSSIENVQGSTGFNDLITGSNGDNNLNGHGGDDQLFGGSGNDTLIGGAGADAMNGGAGLDYASYISSTSEGVGINLQTGVHSGHAAGDSFVDIERFRLTDLVDHFHGTGGAQAAYGAGGNDLLNGGAGNDRLYGEAGDDQISGNSGDDVLIGGVGADILTGGSLDRDGASYETAAAAVSLNLTSGVHTGDAAGDQFFDIAYYLLSAFNDAFTGGAGADEARGASGSDTLNGAGGDDWMRGQEGADALNGDAGDDVLEGGAGGDALNGGAGTDYASYQNAVTLNLTSGVHTGDAAGDTFTSVERFRLSNQADGFTGSGAVDWVVGNGGADTLNGAGGNDTLNGGAGNDVLNGGDGKDKLIGGAGDDALTGAGGGDLFMITDFCGNDTATDFQNGVDRIRVMQPLVDDFSDVAVSSNGSGWAVVTFPDGSTITLTGVTAAQVDESDFVWG